MYSRAFGSAFAGQIHPSLTWADMQQVQAVTQASSSSQLDNSAWKSLRPPCDKGQLFTLLNALFIYEVRAFKCKICFDKLPGFQNTGFQHC